MKNVDSKLLLGLVVGAAVGAAVGYLAASDKREELLEDLKDVANKVKDGFNTAIAKGSEAINSVKNKAAGEAAPTEVAE